MKRPDLDLARAPLLFVLAACGCGGNDGGGGNGPPSPLDYTDPADTGPLRLVKNRAASTQTSVALDLIVGAQPLTGYSTGLDLPLAPGLVQLTAFRPGAALDPGSAPVAAQALVPAAGPLAGMLVVAQSQKATGPGAVPTDTKLAPGAVLFSVQLDLALDLVGTAGTTAGATPPAAVFDGTAPGFVLLSGGLRDRAGLTVVEALDVAIGKLTVNAPAP